MDIWEYGVQYALFASEYGVQCLQCVYQGAIHIVYLFLLPEFTFCFLLRFLCFVNLLPDVFLDMHSLYFCTNVYCIVFVGNI